VLAWNKQLFLLLNAPAHPSEWLRMAAVAFADGAVAAAIALMLALWIWARRVDRAALLSTAAGVAVALALNQAVSLLWYEPRPFMIGLGHTFLPHAPENSFPSDHGTLVWSLGLGLVATDASRLWGWAVCLAGIAVAWARIYLGLHFPIDMLASSVVAAIGAASARLTLPGIRRWAMPLALPAY